jgi:hypothetical protein
MHPSTLSLSSGQDLRITQAGLHIHGEMTLDQWTELLASLQNVRHAYHCALGDAINYGRARFSNEEIAIALEQLEFDLNEVTKAECIGQLTLDFRERNPLSSEHYFVLSKHDAGIAKKWAAIAVERNLNALELKRSIEAGKVLHSSDIQRFSGQGSGINTIQGVVFRLQSWETSMGGRDKILKLPVYDRMNVLNLLRPAIELASMIEQSIPEDEQ